tara:strand:- start:617 stop:2008 length:1392 start_codon:yes stop_codon:yes gene_type:complete
VNKVTPIILSGGIGTRLWPLSTKNLPKQFLKLPFYSKNNLFEQTILGLKRSAIFNKPLIVCSEKHKFLVLDSLSRIKSKYSNIIVEKLSKNTAPSILIGSLFSMNVLRSKFSLILPSDHFVKQRNYTKLIPSNINEIKNHIIYGIKPHFPSEDYGYIKIAGKLKKLNDILSFHEKPNKKKAEQFIKDDYFWNSGIFLLNNEKLISDFEKYQPKILEISSKIIKKLKKDLQFLDTNHNLMKKLPEISFDNAILEKNDNIKMIKFGQDWTDLGSWNSLMDLSDNNIKLENNSKIYNNSKNSTVVSDRKNTILNDVENIFVISQKESLYISSKKNVNNIKEILNNRNFKSISDYQNIFFKPWGHYETFINSPNYLVKKLTIKPKHRLSLQYHNYRTEHWIIVEGIAKITKGNSQKILKKNESTFIPLGLKHCIENIGKVNLEIIEVQMGKILKESDIIRLDDPYKR